MAHQNKTAALHEKGKPLVISDAAMPQPGPDDIIVRNRAVALNPIDVKQQKIGLFIKKFPHVLGSDIAGEVHEVGSGVSTFRRGDRVVGHAWSMITGETQDGAFGLYVRVPAANAAIIPEEMAFTDAAVLPMAIDTAVCGLYPPGTLSLPWPSTEPKPTGSVLVVYGASSSVGITAVQLAVASGVRVIAIASAHNHDLCKTAGAGATFDYKDSTLVDDVVRTVGGDKFAGIFDAISNEGTYKHDLEMLDKLGGGPFACTHDPPASIPDNVTVKYVFGLGKFSFPLWEGPLTGLLKSSQLRPLPPALIVGKGLDSIEAAIQKLAAGVSAQKVVVEL